MVRGKQYPSWRITCYRGTTRIRERRKTEEEAKARTEKLVEKLGDGTIHFDLKLKPKDTLVITEALRLLKEAGGDPDGSQRDSHDLALAGDEPRGGPEKAC